MGVDFRVEIYSHGIHGTEPTISLNLYSPFHEKIAKKLLLNSAVDREADHRSGKLIPRGPIESFMPCDTW